MLLDAGFDKQDLRKAPEKPVYKGRAEMEYNMNAKKTTIVDSGLLLYLFLIILSYSYFCLLILIFACSSLMSLQKIRNFQCFFFHRAPDIARFVDARNILQGSTVRIPRHKGYSCAPGPFSLKGG